MEQMDVLSPQAERIGAINTVALRDGLLYGDNTDYHGFLAMLAQKGIGVSGRRFTVLGTGGASRAVTTAIRDGGGEVTLVSRTPREGERSYRELERWEGDVLVNCTPVGMHPRTDTCPVGPTVIERHMDGYCGFNLQSSGDQASGTGPNAGQAHLWRALDAGKPETDAGTGALAGAGHSPKDWGSGL